MDFSLALGSGIANGIIDLVVRKILVCPGFYLFKKEGVLCGLGNNDGIFKRRKRIKIIDIVDNIPFILCIP